MIIVQEGNIVPESNSLAIMGLPINKSTLSEGIKKELQGILYKDVLKADNINQMDVVKKLIILERKIKDSIMRKETIYYKPDNIAAMNSYKKSPMSVNGIVAALLYNEMRTEDMPAINLEERNKIIKIKLDITKKNVFKIKDKYPEEYNKLLELLNNNKIPLGTIALPLDVKVPDWVLEFVDYKTIINDQIKNFPLDSIGINRLSNDAVNTSNIIRL